MRAENYIGSLTLETEQAPQTRGALRRLMEGMITDMQAQAISLGQQRITRAFHPSETIRQEEFGIVFADIRHYLHRVTMRQGALFVVGHPSFQAEHLREGPELHSQIVFAAVRRFTNAELEQLPMDIRNAIKSNRARIYNEQLARHVNTSEVA